MLAQAPDPALRVMKSMDCFIMSAVVLPPPPGVPLAMTKTPYEASWVRKGAWPVASAEQPPLPQSRTGSLALEGMVLGA